MWGEKKDESRVILFYIQMQPCALLNRVPLKHENPFGFKAIALFLSALDRWGLIQKRTETNLHAKQGWCKSWHDSWLATNRNVTCIYTVSAVIFLLFTLSFTFFPRYIELKTILTQYHKHPKLLITWWTMTFQI